MVIESCHGSLLYLIAILKSSFAIDFLNFEHFFLNIEYFKKFSRIVEFIHSISLAHYWLMVLLEVSFLFTFIFEFRSGILIQISFEVG